MRMCCTVMYMIGCIRVELFLSRVSLMIRMYAAVVMSVGSVFGFLAA